VLDPGRPDLTAVSIDDLFSSRGATRQFSQGAGLWLLERMARSDQPFQVPSNPFPGIG